MKPKKRGGANHRIYNATTAMDIIKQAIEQPQSKDIGLDDARTLLMDIFDTDFVPSRTTLSKWLEGEMFIKNLSIGAAGGDSRINSPETNIPFTERLRPWVTSYGVTLEEVIFIAKFEAILWTKRNRNGVLSSESDELPEQETQESQKPMGSNNSNNKGKGSSSSVTRTILLAISAQHGLVHYSLASSSSDSHELELALFLKDVVLRYQQLNLSSMIESVFSSRPIEANYITPTIALPENMFAEKYNCGGMARILPIACNLALSQSINIASILIEYLKPALQREKRLRAEQIQESKSLPFLAKVERRFQILDEIIHTCLPSFPYITQVLH